MNTCPESLYRHRQAQSFARVPTYSFDPRANRLIIHRAGLAPPRINKVVGAASSASGSPAKGPWPNRSAAMTLTSPPLLRRVSHTQSILSDLLVLYVFSPQNGPWRVPAYRYIYILARPRCHSTSSHRCSHLSKFLSALIT